MLPRNPQLAKLKSHQLGGAMSFFSRLIRQEEPAARVNLDDGPNTFYFDSTLQRWRERGTEHLEEDLDHGAAPHRKRPEPLQPEPEPVGKAVEEKNVIDELMAPPRVYSTHVLDLRDRAEKLKSPKGVTPGAAVPSLVDVHACDDVATEPPNSPIFTEVSEHSDIPESPLEAPALTRTFAATRSDDEQMSLLLPILTEFSSGIKVYAQACAALEKLTFDDAKRQAMIIHSGGVQDLFCALERFQDEDPVQQLPILELLWSITFNASALDGLLEDVNTWRSLESILRSTKSAGRLQAIVCGILINFTEREALRREICRRGICGLICSALHFHHCSELHEHGCQLLYLLAYYPELRPAVLAAGAVEAAKISDEKWGQWVQEILLC
eukprot:s474_g16.t1